MCGQLVGFDRPDRDVGTAAWRVGAVRTKRYSERASVHRERPGIRVQVRVQVNHQTPPGRAHQTNQNRAYFNVNVLPHDAPGPASLTASLQRHTERTASL